MCYICGEQFNNEEDLRGHIENIEAFLKIYCKKCNSFITLEESMFHQDMSYFCSMCKLMLKPDTYLAHDCLHSNKSLANSLKRECETCKKIFFSEFILEKHINEHHLNVKIGCKCCKMTFPNVQLHDKHKLCKHYKKSIHYHFRKKKTGQKEKICDKKEDVESRPNLIVKWNGSNGNSKIRYYKYKIAFYMCIYLYRASFLILFPC